MNGRFPPSPYPKLFRIVWQLYTFFLPKATLNRGWGGGLLFVFRGDGSRAQKLENRWNCLNRFCPGLQHPEYMQQYSYTEDALCYKNHSDIKLRPCGSPYLICALVFTLTYMYSSIQLVQWANGIAGVQASCPAEFYHNQSETEYFF